MPRLLILNSNTTAAVTELVATHVRAVLGDSCEIVPATARFGARYISNEAAYAIAGHSALDALAEAGPRIDGVLLACFGDPGLFALREVSRAPVTGLAEAAMVEAERHGRYAIVTGGVLWKVMLERLAQALGMQASIAAIRPITLTGDRIAADPDGALDFLAAEANAAVRENGAQAVVLGGAALAGLAERIADRVPVPLIDSVHAGARVAAARMAARPAVAPASPPGPTPTVGLGDALARLLAPPP